MRVDAPNVRDPFAAVDVEEFVLDRFELFDVLEAAYDPRFLDRSAEIIDARLPEAMIIRVEPQSKAMRQALAAFERGVAEGIIRHRGDPVIAEHVDWAGVDRGESDEVRRVFKLDRSRPIDAVIAMSLAYWRVSVGGGVSEYDTRGLLVI